MCDPTPDDFDTLRQGARRLLRHERFETDIRALAVKMDRLAPYYETIQPLNNQIQAAIRRLEDGDRVVA